MFSTQSARLELNIVVDFIPVGSSNRPGAPLTAQKITIHNTDNTEPTADAQAHARYQKSSDAQKRQVSWHFSVDDHSVFQSLPVDEVGWHAGTHAGNYQSIGIEICENEGIDQQAANERAALLVALQLHELNIPLGNVVQHHDWSGKNCPALLREPPAGWEAFLKRVEEYYQQFDLDDHEHDHPMIAMAENVELGDAVVLSWDDDLHPGRAQWTQQLAQSVVQYKDQLDLGSPDEFAGGYSALPAAGQVKFWCELLIAMSKFEASWNPNDVFKESDGQNSIGLLQLSINDQKNYKVMPEIASEEELKDPLINIQWAVAILAYWTEKDRVIASGIPGDNRGGSRYWSVLRGGSSHHYVEIKSLTKAHSGLG